MLLLADFCGRGFQGVVERITNVQYCYFDFSDFGLYSSDNFCIEHAGFKSLSM